MKSNELSGTTFISPKTINELYAAVEKYPRAHFFAGGTYVMLSHSSSSIKNREIINLSYVSELSKILHADQFFEAGCMLTLQQLLNKGGYSLTKSIYKAIENIGTTVLRNQITVGGSLCVPDVRYAMSVILATVSAQAELRFVSHGGVLKQIGVKSRWIPVSKLYNSDGSLFFSDKTILTKVRIPIDKNRIQIFKTIGSPCAQPDHAVIMGIQYAVKQNTIVSPSFCLSFLRNGFFCNASFADILRTLKFPLSSDSIKRISTELKRMIAQDCPNVTEIQVERAKRVTIATLYDANFNYFGS